MGESECSKWGRWFFEYEELEEWIALTRKHKKSYYWEVVETGFETSGMLGDLKKWGKLEDSGSEGFLLAYSAAYAYFLDPTIDAPEALIEALRASKFELTRRARLGAWLSVLGLVSEGRPFEELRKIVSPDCSWESDCEHLAEILVKAEPSLEPITPQEAYDELRKRWR